MDHFPNLTPAEIERTTQRLHRVARAWVDDAGAHDLAQGAWLRVSAGEFSGIRKLETFLIGVVRNLARKQARSEHRRGHREQQAARPEAIASAAELAERNELAARLASAIGELPEPQRTAILLRYDEGLTAVEIAANLGIPPGTVRSRLKRARQTLQLKLQDPNSPPGNWALFLPAWAPKPSLSSAIGVLLMSSFVKWTLAAVCGLLFTIGGWHLVTGNDLKIDAEEQLTQEQVRSSALTGAINIPLRQALKANGVDKPGPWSKSNNPTPQAARILPAPEYEPQEISGTLTLPDGTPVERYTLTATMLTTSRGDAPANPEGRSHRTTTEINGAFSFRNLQPGSYELKALNRGIAIQSVDGLTQFQTDANHLLLVTDAILATLRIKNSSGSQIPIATVRATSEPFQNLPPEKLYFGGTGGTPQAERQLLIPAGIAITIHAMGIDGQHYFASVRSSEPPGSKAITLTQDSGALGELSLSLQGAELPDGASLEFTLLDKNGQDVHLFEPWIQAVHLKKKHVFHGLVPGEYILHARLWESSTIRLAQSTFEVTVFAGDEHSLSLKTAQGAALTVSASTEPALPIMRRGKVEFRKLRQVDWAPLNLTWSTTEAPFYPGKLYKNMGAKLLVGGPAGISNALEPGAYEVKITLKGHLPAIQEIMIRQDETTELEFVLNPE